MESCVDLFNDTTFVVIVWCKDFLSLLDSLIEMEFWYQMKAPIFLITPVKSYVQFTVQQMLLVKVKSENVATVRSVTTTIITIHEFSLRFHL